MSIKRFTLLLFLLLFITTISACVWDRNAGKRPIDQPGTKWVSSEPFIWFETHDPEDRLCSGEIELDGELISIVIFFYYDTRISVKTSPAANTTVFYGECEFGEDTLSVVLSKEKLLDQHPLYHIDESIETLVFQREDD